MITTTQTVKILTAVSKLWAAVITVARVVLVVGFPAAALAGARCGVEVAGWDLVLWIQECLWLWGSFFSSAQMFIVVTAVIMLGTPAITLADSIPVKFLMTARCARLQVS